jgi:hypothetical protein
MKFYPKRRKIKTDILMWVKWKLLIGFTSITV